jgi:hypothetical protein
VDDTQAEQLRDAPPLGQQFSFVDRRRDVDHGSVACACRLNGSVALKTFFCTRARKTVAGWGVPLGT